MRNLLTFVISSAARELVFSATYEEKISQLRLEMTIATQSLAGEGEDKGVFRVKCMTSIIR